MMQPPIQKNKSVGITHALRGLLWACGDQINLKIQLTIAVITIIVGVSIHISTTEWLFIVSAIAVVFIAELLNTSIEQATDAITQSYSTYIKRAKDTGAAAVLIASIYAAVVGTIIFMPKLI